MTASDLSQDATTRLAFVGDIMLGRKVTARLMAGRAAAAFWGDVRPHCLAADAVIGNLEAPITATEQRWRGIKSFRFRAHPRAIEILAAGNVKCVALANNHILDCGCEGLAETRKYLALAGIAHAGAGSNLAEAIEPALFRAGSRTVGLLSLTNTMRPFAAHANSAGTYCLPIRRNRAMLDLLDAHVRNLLLRGADLLVLSVHWGPNLRPWPPRRYREFAHAAIECGFHVVHGHSAHLLQAVEFHRPGLILFDTADFIDDFWIFPGIRTDRSCLFLAEFGASGALRLKLLPVSLRLGETMIARSREADAILQTVIRRSRRYAVEFSRDGDFLIATPKGSGNR